MTTAMDIAYKVWQDLGKIDSTEEFIATGGSTTTVVNGKIADRQDRAEDNYSIDGTVMVVRDAGGASAAPQGEMQRISLYASSTYTHTVDTAFTAAVASGDSIAIANADIPLREMYRAINNFLFKFGEIPLSDTSLTSVSHQTEYTLPVALKRQDLLRVDYQGITDDANDNDWIPIYKYDVIPSLPGSTATLILPQIVSSRTIRILYMGVHPAITTFSSTISEYIHPAVVVAGVTKQVLRWYNGNSGGGENYWLQRENEAAEEYEMLSAKYPLEMPISNPKYFSYDFRGKNYRPELDARNTG